MRRIDRNAQSFQLDPCPTALALVRYLLSHESQLFIRQNTLSIPALKRAAEWQGEEAVAHPSRFHMYRETIPTFMLYTELNVSAEELLRIRQELKLYWSQIDDLETVCRRLEETVPPPSNTV